ncbi:MAG: helix-turn-helix transcriptional regulator [Planctomycetaceae bacterium]|nr:helix-turn-helix transcriptional regulator [Planctomycetaceae bacterium]
MQKSRFTKKYGVLLLALRAARERAGLTQTDVAKRFGAHASFVSKCESGERRIDILELAQFCKLYGVKLAVFLQSIGVE